jgi:hypothetical protein
VDRQTLQCCFEAFNLTLETEDYCWELDGVERQKAGSAKTSVEEPLKTLGEAIDTTQTPSPPIVPKGQLPLA